MLNRKQASKQREVRTGTKEAWDSESAGGEGGEQERERRGGKGIRAKEGEQQQETRGNEQTAERAFMYRIKHEKARDINHERPDV